MSDELMATIEYEALVLGRHLAGLPGRARRSGGVLDLSAYTLLSILQVGGPASIGGLSAITGLDASTLNRQTAALLRDDYARRIPDPGGGIARKFEITLHGQRVLAEERTASRQVLSQIVSDWTAQDQQTFANLLYRVNTAIEQRSGRSWPRAHPEQSP